MGVRVVGSGCVCIFEVFSGLYVSYVSFHLSLQCDYYMYVMVGFAVCDSVWICGHWWVGGVGCGCVCLFQM